MPLFEGHKDSGLQRLFIEMPDDAKSKVVWKYPDQQIIQHSLLNVDLDYQAVFTNLGKVIGVLGPGRHTLDEGASLTLGWLVDRLTGNAYYDAEVYFVATRELPNIEFGGPVDNLTDGPTGLVVTVRVFGELAFKVVDPPALLARLVGTGSGGDLDGEMTTWAKDQTLAAIRAVLPDIVAEHGVLAMGRIQDQTAQAALAKANETLTPYGIQLTTFGELNVNLPDADVQQLKQLAATKAYTNIAGSFDSAVRGEAALEIAQGVAEGHVGAQPGIVAGMMMGVPVAPTAQAAPAAPMAPPPNTPAPVPTAASPQSPAPPQQPAEGAPAPMPAAGGDTPAQPAATTAPPAAIDRQAAGSVPPSAVPTAHFCSQCGAALAPAARFCADCGAAVQPAAA